MRSALWSAGRARELVVFALFGGVPEPLARDGPDWTKIVGQDPDSFNFSGIDPHMIESIRPRSALPCQTGAPPSCDPINGKEWDTTTSKAGLDLQYACVFTLPVPKDCTKLPDAATCDCGGSYAGPLCDPNPSDGNKPTLQARGKAYPAIRELRVAKAVGESGIVGSINPTRIDSAITMLAGFPTRNACATPASATTGLPPGPTTIVSSAGR